MITKGKLVLKKTVGGGRTRSAASVPPPASRTVTAPLDVSEVASADPAVKKAAVAKLSALPEVDMCEMCGERGIDRYDQTQQGPSVEMSVSNTVG